MSPVYFILVFSNQLITIVGFALVARVLISWVSPHTHNKITEMLHVITEPVLKVVRLIPHQIGLIDLSPLIALFALDFLKMILRYFLSPFL